MIYINHDKKAIFIHIPKEIFSPTFYYIKHNTPNIIKKIKTAMFSWFIVFLF